MSRIAVLAAALLLPVAAQAQARAARAVLKDAKGEKVGMALLVAAADGVNVSVRVRGLAPGKHALHHHATGRCEAPDFLSAGPHLNPAGRKHGARNPEGPHLGDLPNLEVGADGIGQSKVLVKGTDLGDGPASLFQQGGTAVVLHAQPVDEVTDPGGNAGARIACGVVTHGGE
jgi:Cu-Zn family superoxide dismutase